MKLRPALKKHAQAQYALTARPPPYKHDKTLTDSLRILGLMKLDHHVDQDLFDAFIRDKVYLKYADPFLDTERIDEVN